MKVLRIGSTPDRTGSLIDVWQRSFTAPDTWRDSLRAGVHALVAELDADPEVSDACVLAQVPDTLAGPLVWHRELVRGQVISTMVEHWYRCGGDPVPELTFEMFLGEVCTLLRERLEEGRDYGDLPAATVALWGGDSGA